MIIGMHKYLFFGTSQELDHFFFRAQQQGFVEFISPYEKRLIETPEEIEQILFAMKVLKKQPVLKQYTGEHSLHFAQKVSFEILELYGEVEKYAEEKRLLEAEVARVAPFGNFSMEDIHYIETEGKRKIQFFCRKSLLGHDVDLPEEVFYVATSYDLDYYISISPEARHYPKMIEMRIDRPHGDLKRQLLEIGDLLHEKEQKLKQYAIYLEALHEALVELLNHDALDRAKKEVSYPMGSFFAVEAWVPQNKKVALFSLLDGMAVHCEQIAIEQEDKVPTCMENKGIARIGEDLVRIYDIPAVTDKDPSLWVLGAFSLFFSMIVADAGYGLLYLGLAFYLRYKFPLAKASGKRIVQLFTILASACIAWGVISSAYFGIKMEPGSFLSRISLIHHLAEKKAEYHRMQNDDVYKQWVLEYPAVKVANSGREVLQAGILVNKEGHTKHELLNDLVDNILLEVALLIGILHISSSFLRYLSRHFAGIGWIAFMLGGYLYFPNFLHATSIVHFLGMIDKGTSKEIGLQLIYGGMGGAMLLGMIQQGWKGIKEIASVISVFADVLSYLRLYALALASTIMAETFNEQGIAVGLALGMLVMFAGHSVNMVLAMMGGVIHGLRLNFLEWFHYSFEGGGRLFKPLKKLRL